MLHCGFFSGVFPLPNVKLTWGKFDLFADKMTAEVNPHSECYEVCIQLRKRNTNKRETPSGSKINDCMAQAGVNYQNIQFHTKIYMLGDNTQGSGASRAAFRDNVWL